MSREANEHSSSLLFGPRRSLSLKSHAGNVFTFLCLLLIGVSRAGAHAFLDRADPAVESTVRSPDSVFPSTEREPTCPGFDSKRRQLVSVTPEIIVLVLGEPLAHFLLSF
jgi:hypothetical protein